ncbi:LANO_0E00980g1_1 [Lachancea nothofagi CBS 11611]|uniref:LANO_0E00980g1_1 n=1 Tax=Lachancea nothofagi CBS 11611 TaxID=1266666 RepID=A0A1G4JPI4_9SACH|nr:LANO_0E00980g1_1 [Lachancea nothofagi CBS 11611]
MTNLTRRIHRKTGCVPCKIRKKRCSEHKPTCTDCDRLGISCVYLPSKCPKEEVNYYRERVESELSERKRRRPSGATTTIGKESLDDPIEEITSNAVSADLSEEEFQLVSYEEPLDTNFLELTRLAFSPPQPLSDPLLMRLDDTALHLYNYYRESLSQIVSIAPSRQNYYLQIFLPMAHQNEGILYGILAWAAHHLSLGGNSVTTGGQRLGFVKETSPAALDDIYREIPMFEDETAPSSSSLSSSSSTSREFSTQALSACSDAGGVTSTQPDPRYAALANEYTLYSLQRLANPETHGLLLALANILVLCGAEICQGDVARWRVLLQCGARMIKDYAPNSNIGELLADSEKAASQKDAKVTRWLLSNFVYHDILGSDKTHFPMQQYDRILQDPNSSQNYPVDPLYGVNRPIFRILGQVKNLGRKLKHELSTATHPKILLDESPLFEIMAVAQGLQESLYNMAPSENDLAWYLNLADSGDDARPLAQTLFSVFRTTALLHLKSAVLRQDIRSYEIQFLVLKLSDELDKVLGSPLEGGLCFPLFICGVNAFYLAQRSNVQNKFADFLKRYKFRNVERALSVLLQLWQSYDRGLTRDWYDIVDEIGWDLNFA